MAFDVSAQLIPVVWGLIALVLIASVRSLIGNERN